MEMTNEEIVRSYRQAKEPRDQITILAELNLCGTAKIVEILIAGGIDPKTLPKIKLRSKPFTTREVIAWSEPPKEDPEPQKEEPKDTLERDIEAKLRKRVKLYGGRCLKWVSPGESGVPDRIVLLPGGRVIFVETKKKGGTLSKLQNFWGRTLRDLGFEVWVVWDRKDLAVFEEKALKRSEP